jgi:hypothetical protein
MSGGGSKTTYDWEAANTYAEVSRDQWEDYKARFQPWEKEMISMAADDGSQDVEMAKSYAMDAVHDERNAMNQARTRMGVAPSREQTAAEGRRFSLDSTMNQANAANTARQHAEARRASVMSGGMSALGKATGRTS